LRGGKRLPKYLINKVYFLLPPHTHTHTHTHTHVYNVNNSPRTLLGVLSIGAPRDLVPTNEIYSFRDTLLTCLCHVLPKAFVFLLSTYSPSHCKIKGSIFKKYSLIGFHFVIFSFCIVYCNTPSFFKNMFARSTMYHLCSHLNIPFLLAFTILKAAS
jgi:hypothetical protein